MRAAWRQFRAAEDGLGTIMALFGVMICLVLAGIAVDTGNAWRSREQLQITADVAAHAGAAAIARGGSAQTAISVAVGATELNMPAASYGRILSDPYEDVSALHYDATLNRLARDGPVNAVSVRVQRSRATGNPVGTFLIKLAGIGAWDVAAASAAAVVPTRRCNPADGIYAGGKVTIAGQSAVGADYCLHGQKGVALEGVSLFKKGSGLSMPDLSICGGRCSDLTNPGIEGAMAEANLILADAAAHINRLAAGFTDPNETLPEEDAFFRDRLQDGDLEPLAELGVPVEALRTGDVVTLSPLQVARLHSYPPGLIYHVPCSDAAGGRLTITGYGMGIELRNLALVTDCALDLEATVTLTGALVISTSKDAMQVMNGALAGDPEGKCSPGSATQVFSLADLDLPSTFTASNATFLTPGDIRVAGHPAGAPAPHAGLGLHAGGRIHLAGSHSFSACGAERPAAVPELRVIRQVAPRGPVGL